MTKISFGRYDDCLLHFVHLGIKWWNLQRSSAFELPWPREVAISNGGDMLAAITPKGRI